MTTEIFTSLLFCTSLFSGLVTESLKKFFDVPSNILAGASSIGTALMVIVYYTISFNVLITLQYVISCVALCILSWISSMVGYDKVIQTIKQLGA